MRSQDEQLLRLPPVWSKLSLPLFLSTFTLQSILWAPALPAPKDR
jgi:hypothetical protein